jgi:CheY-like chemotaxis protein
MAGSTDTVLLIEDEPVIRMGTCAMLEDSGYRVLEAANADEAKALLVRHPEISFILTDVQMPGSMDGLQFASLVSREHAHIPVLITSGRTGLKDAQQHGAMVYIAKPYTADVIRRALLRLKANG